MTAIQITPGTATTQIGLWLGSVRPQPDHGPRDRLDLAAKLWIRKAAKHNGTLEQMRAADTWSCRESDIKFWEAVKDQLFQEQAPAHSETTTFNNTPIQMQQRPRWVVWRREERDGKLTKIPYQPNGAKASSTDPSTWISFEDAVKTAATGCYTGIGFVLGLDVDIGKTWIGIDWDKQHPDEIHDEIVSLGSYGELSPSGNGAHVIAWGTKPGKKSRKSNIEIYDSGRYFTVTGDHIEDTPKEIRDININALQAIYQKIDPDEESHQPKQNTRRKPDLSDNEIIEKCQNASNSAKFNALWRGNTSGYDSHSNADLALCSILAFYTQDAIQLDRLVRRSGLYREKWDRTDYATGTIGEALKGTGETWSPGGQDTRHRQPQQKTEPQPLENRVKSIAAPRLDLSLIESDNFIHQYINCHMKLSGGHREFKYAAAISLLSLVSDRRVLTRLSFGPVYPNVYALLLGVSSDSGKSTSLNEFKNAAIFIHPDFLSRGLPSRFSPEGFFKSLALQPHGYFLKDELASLLAGMNKEGGYLAGFRDDLCEYFDCPDTSVKMLARGNQIASEIHLTCLAATTISSFERHVNVVDLESGLLARFLVIKPNEAPEYRPVEIAGHIDRQPLKNLVERLSKTFALLQKLKTLVLEPSESALAIYNTWDRERMANEHRTDTEKAIGGRLRVYVFKLAMIYYIGSARFNDVLESVVGDEIAKLAHGAKDNRLGIFTKSELRIPDEYLEAALCHVKDYFLPLSVRGLEGAIANSYENHMNRIIQALRKAPDNRMTRAELIRNIPRSIPSKELDALLQLLHDEGIVFQEERQGPGKNGRAYVTTTITLMEVE